MIQRLIPLAIAAMLVVLGVFLSAHSYPRIGPVVIVIGLLSVFVFELVSYALAGRVDRSS